MADYSSDEDVAGNVGEGISQGLARTEGQNEDETKAEKKRKRKTSMMDKRRDERMSKLEEELFGKSDLFAPSLSAQEEELQGSEDREEEATTPLYSAGGLSFVLDDEGEGEEMEEEGEKKKKKKKKKKEGEGERRPAWIDEEEENLTVSIAGVSRRRKLRKDAEENDVDGNQFSQRLREKYKQLSSRTAWANLSSRTKAGEDDGIDGGDGDGDAGERARDALLRKTGSLLAARPSKLPPQIVEATRVKDGNEAEPSSCVLQDVDFHPTSMLMLTAGFDKMLRLFDIDGAHNPKVRSAFFGDMPIRRAKFLNENSILATGRRPFCYKFHVEKGVIEKIAHVSGFEKASLENFALSRDLNCISFLGRHGNVALVSTKTHKKIAEFKVDDRATCGAFTSDKELFVASSRGEISRFDLRTYRCIDRFSDEGNLKATSINVSNGGTCAVGSDSGVVNVYEGGAGAGAPKKAIMNLTTKIDRLCFNQAGSILAMSSSMKRDSLRLVHVGTKTVFSNWPTSKTPLHYVHCTAFSSGSGYLAVGNARGKVLLYRLPHFDEC